MTALNVLENKQLRRLEATIQKGAQAFVEVGQALATIRDERLYRESHKTFEAYCQERWSFTRQNASLLIKAAEVDANLSSSVDIPKPSSVRQSVELAKLPDEEQPAAWQEVLNETDGEPTTAAVKAVVERKLPERNKIIPVPDTEDEDAEGDVYSVANPSANPNADLDAVKAGYLALSFAKQVAMCDFIQDHPPTGE